MDENNKKKGYFQVKPFPSPVISEIPRYATLKKEQLFLVAEQVLYKFYSITLRNAHIFSKMTSGQ